MLDNIKSAADTNLVPDEGKTQTASPTDKTLNASEGDKTPKTEEELRFDKHSRFKELVDEKNKAKEEANEWRDKYEQLTSAQKDKARDKASDLTGIAPAEIPKFETVEELVQWVMSQKQAIRDETLAEIENRQNSQTAENREVDDFIVETLDDLAKEDESLLTKEGRKKFLQFVDDYEAYTNIPKAFELFKKLEETKAEGFKQGEGIAKRKANSGLKSTSTGSTEQKMTFRRGQSMDDIFAEAKRNLAT